MSQLFPINDPRGPLCNEVCVCGGGVCAPLFKCPREGNSRNPDCVQIHQQYWDQSERGTETQERQALPWIFVKLGSTLCVEHSSRKARYEPGRMCHSARCDVFWGFVLSSLKKDPRCSSLSSPKLGRLLSVRRNPDS